jgi:Phosphoglycerate dehydrogenase and related dehydrogenases
VPFRNPVAVYDPWLPDELILSHDCRPTPLDELLAGSRIVFVMASVTTENEGFLGRRELSLMQDGAALLLMSRAAVVDFPELLRQVKLGRLRAAIDVFPEEPAPANDAARRSRRRNPALGPSHRRHAGGLPCHRAHDPGRCRAHPARPAAPALPAGRPRPSALRLRSKPVTLS